MEEILAEVIVLSDDNDNNEEDDDDNDDDDEDDDGGGENSNSGVTKARYTGNQPTTLKAKMRARGMVTYPDDRRARLHHRDSVDFVDVEEAISLGHGQYALDQTRNPRADAQRMHVWTQTRNRVHNTNTEVNSPCLAYHAGLSLKNKVLSQPVGRFNNYASSEVIRRDDSSQGRMGPRNSVTVVIQLPILLPILPADAYRIFTTTNKHKSTISMYGHQSTTSSHTPTPLHTSEVVLR